MNRGNEENNSVWDPAPKDVAEEESYSITDIYVGIKKHIDLGIKNQTLVFGFWDSTQTFKCKFVFLNSEI